MAKYRVTIAYAFSDQRRVVEFDTLGEALAVYDVAKDVEQNVHHITITPPDGYGTTWTHPRFLDLTFEGGKKGADFERMRDYMKERAGIKT